MSSPERIYLQPACCVDPTGERRWSEDNVWDWNDGCEAPGVEYVRADLVASPDPGAAVIERAAKIVYDAMVWASRAPEHAQPPSWVERGNSFAQDEARKAAHKIVDLQATLIAKLRQAKNRAIAARILAGDGGTVTPQMIDAAFEVWMDADGRPASDWIREALEAALAARRTHTRAATPQEQTR